MTAYALARPQHLSHHQVQGMQRVSVVISQRKGWGPLITKVDDEPIQRPHNNASIIYRA